MKISRFAVLMSGLALATVSAHAGTVYLDDSLGNLWAGDPTTALYTLVGNSGITGGFTDIGFAAGVLYGLDSGGNLYSVNTSTAAPTLIGNTGITDGSLVGLSDSTSGLLIAGGNGNIFTVNTGTAALTPGTPGGAYQTAGDLDFDGSGNLWLTSTTPAADTLYQVDPVTGAILYNAGTLPFANVFGVAYDSENGTLYGFEVGGTQFDINTTNAASSGTDVTFTGISDPAGLLGAAFIASPEPSTFASAAIGSALILFALYRRRRTNRTV